MKNKEEIENKIDKEIESESQNDERRVELYTGYGNDLYHSFWDDLFFDRPLRRELGNLQNLMRTDIEETAKGYEFKIEVPGFERKDINIGFENGYLSVAVNKTGSGVMGQNKYLRRERVASACSRSFYVGDIDQTQISATLSDGILTVTVPKEIKRQRHQIEIK